MNRPLLAGGRGTLRQVSAALRRLLLQVFKWLILPVALLLVGYLWVGPILLPRLVGGLLPTPSESLAPSSHAVKKSQSLGEGSANEVYGDRQK